MESGRRYNGLVFLREFTRVKMPIYEYRCRSCGFEKEYLQKLSDAPITECPSCGKAEMGKLVSAAGFQLKGSGWYATDFKNSGTRKDGADKAEKKEDGESPGSKSSTASESSPASQSSAASESTGGEKSGSSGGKSPSSGDKSPSSDEKSPSSADKSAAPAGGAGASQ
jgi:putative FmdB family regulatory protein